LEEAQAQVAALKASNETLREETTESSLRFERTIEALKIAAVNAACARTDADQAETSAEGLATQLEALKTVVDQTKQAAQLLHEEQEEISAQARNGQAKLLQVEAELARSQKETKQLRQKTEEWQSKAKQLQEETVSLKRQLADKTEQARKLTTALEERDALEDARKKRSQQVEQELREAQALLVEATSVAADVETLQSLNESVEQLQTANKMLHDQLVTQQESAREEKERLRESLLLAEKDAQQLRIEASLQKDQAERQTLKASDGEKGNTAVSPDGGDQENDDTSFFSCRMNMRTPTPKSTTRRESRTVPLAANCSICFKAAFGLMKSCQCGNPNCDKRAHLTCANQINPGPSVSHPGTPAPKLPIVLCSSVLSGIIKN
jgi:chromosome segregation ATPase